MALMHPSLSPILQTSAVTEQVAGRTNDAAGDGTTTAAVLARELIYHGLQVSIGTFSGE